ncbi:hypothetical protein P280DRAFT_275172 [Massarina eburnea CBS 473.64]|uniref:Uncharacterized protein n=1 Tax=Massarina eburnea CBS 473.64 TaxID=1395130 RepID=A0A6A6S9D5_9PLEO|nr:hypothetical protein P280DRAFT_275172 [Massarina eburnea CBS 473.64]
MTQAGLPNSRAQAYPKAPTRWRRSLLHPPPIPHHNDRGSYTRRTSIQTWGRGQANGASIQAGHRTDEMRQKRRVSGASLREHKLATIYGGHGTAGVEEGEFYSDKARTQDRAERRVGRTRATGVASSYTWNYQKASLRRSGARSCVDVEAIPDSMEERTTFRPCRVER